MMDAPARHKGTGLCGMIGKLAPIRKELKTIRKRADKRVQQIQKNDKTEEYHEGNYGDGHPLRRDLLESRL